MIFSEEQKDYIIHALEHCEVLTGGRSSGKTLELIKQQDKEIERLNNIINELEKWLKEEYEATVFDYHNAIEDVLNKLQELKGNENNE